MVNKDLLVYTTRESKTRQNAIETGQRSSGDSLVLHCASLTAHNKMAAVKKNIQSNIIKIKLTEEKRYKNFRLRLILAEMRLSGLGMSIT